jgi:putative transposase
MAAVEQMSPHIGVVHACATLGVNRARVYRVRSRRRHLAGAHVQRKARPRPPLALSLPERETLLLTLNSERFADVAPASVYATLLDEGCYLASASTMYRLLVGAHAVRERRNQLTHPPYAKPQLLASAPCQVWSWDITKLKGPGKWSCFHLYVILDIFSRYVVGWMVAPRESAALAKKLIANTVAKQRIAPATLTLHADRGSSMRSKAVAQLLVDLEITKSHSRPHVSDDNPYYVAPKVMLRTHPC